MSTTPGSPKNLRSDIQALRAIAVTLVIANHFWPRHLTGGYIGVDIFFVISGYLITLHLL
ncbi:acyltransferase family protein, partial [Rothia nasimurium]